MARSRESLETKIRVAELFSIYGELLSERQSRFIDLHYNDDLSLSEIAGGVGISRQAVFDAIKQGKKRLDRFDSVLNLSSDARKGKAKKTPGKAVDPRMEIDGILHELEQVARSGVIYNTARVRECIDSIRGFLRQT